MRVPPSKSMPKLTPWPAMASAPMSRIDPGHREEPARGAHVVEAELEPLLARAERRAAADQPRPAHRVQDRLRGDDRREQRDEDAQAEREGEALDARGGEDEEDERHQEGDDVRVDDRGQALAVARHDRLADTSAGAHLFLDAFEDDDVRVRGHAEREDQPRDARQGHRDRDQLDQRVEVERVDAQRERGDDAEHAVEDDQEQRDDHEARDAGDQALVQRLGAEAGGDLRARDQLELDRQGADLEDLRQVLRRGDREAAGDLRAGRAVDAVRVLLVVDERRRDQLVVEHDREVLRGVAAGRRPGACCRRRAGRSGAVISWNALRPLSVKSNVTIGPPPPLLVEVLLGVLDVGAGQRRVVLDDPPAVRGRRLLAVLADRALLVADDEDADGDLEDLGVLALLRRRARRAPPSRSGTSGR